MELTRLNSRWLPLFPDVKQCTASSCFDELAVRYSEPHRHYHTLEHVSACLELFDFVRDRLDDPLAVELALWFHDVIYEPTESDNEERSARFAEAALDRLDISPELAGKIARLIVVTKHPSEPSCEDEAFMLDIDLAILASPADHYLHYAAQIREEYSHVPESLYRKGRAAVLESFVRQEAIYHTPHFLGRFEAEARRNMNDELCRLADGV